MAEHEGGGADRLADPAVIDQLAAGLPAAAQERVRGAAQQHALGLGGLDGLAAVLAVDRQRLFAVDVLAGRDGGHVHFEVGLGDRSG